MRNRGLVALARGDLDAASSYLDESLALRVELDDRAGIAESLEGQAELTALREDPVRAAELLGTAEAIRADVGAARAAQESAAIDAVERRLRASLGPSAFAAAHRRGVNSPRREAHKYR